MNMIFEHLFETYQKICYSTTYDEEQIFLLSTFILVPAGKNLSLDETDLYDKCF